MRNGQLSKAMRRICRVLGPPDGAHLSDRLLLERFIAAHDEKAFEAVVARHGALVWGTCQRVLDNPQDVEDVFQATFLLLARKAGSVGWHDSVGSWLYASAYHLAAKFRLQIARRRKYEQQAAAMPSRNASEAVEARELGTVIDEELQRLPGKYRMPLLLCYLHGKTREEAAEQLGWSPGAVKGRLERGREILRRRLTRRGLSLSAGLLSALLVESGTAAVPDGLVQSTLALLTSEASASPVVLALVKGAAHAMFLSKLKFAASAVILIAVLGVASGLSAFQLGEPARQADGGAPVADGPPLFEQQIRDLDAADFALRHRATKRLLHSGPRSLPSLQKALAARPSLEVRTRLEQIIETIELQQAPEFQLHAEWTPGKGVREMTLSPQGRWLALGDGRLLDIDLKTEKQLPRKAAWPFGTTDRFILCDAETQAERVGCRLYDSELDKQTVSWVAVKAAPGASYQPVAVSASGKYVALQRQTRDGYALDEALLCDLSQGQVLHVFKDVKSPGNSVASFSPDEKHFLLHTRPAGAAKGRDYVLNIWDIGASRLVGTLGAWPAVQTAGYAVSPDGKYLVNGNAAYEIRRIDLATAKQEVLLHCNEKLGSHWLELRLCRGGNVLAVWSGERSPLLTCNTSTKEIVVIPSDMSSGRFLGLDSKGLHAFITRGRNGGEGSDRRSRLEVWDLAYRKIAKEFPGFASCTLSADGRVLASWKGENEGAVQIWKARPPR